MMAYTPDMSNKMSTPHAQSCETKLGQMEKSFEDGSAIDCYKGSKANLLDSKIF